MGKSLQWPLVTHETAGPLDARCQRSSREIHAAHPRTFALSDRRSRSTHICEPLSAVQHRICHHQDTGTVASREQSPGDQQRDIGTVSSRDQQLNSRAEFPARDDNFTECVSAIVCRRCDRRTRCEDCAPYNVAVACTYTAVYRCYEHHGDRKCKATDDATAYF